jgi:hypothetical protein
MLKCLKADTSSTLYAKFKIINENMNLKKLAEQLGTSVNTLDKYCRHLDVGMYSSEMAVKSVVKS